MHIIEPFIEIGWERRFRWLKKPWHIGKRIVILPPNLSYKPQSSEIIIKMDPAGAFGTGGHATTMCCLLYLEEIVKGGENVLDVGTGTGILGMAACMLGAAKAVGIDISYRASAVALQNIKRNGLDKRMYIVCSDIESVKGRFEIIVSNLRTEIIISILEKLKNLLQPSGKMILSGILESEEPAFSLFLRTHHICISKKVVKEGWVAFLCSLDT